MKKITYALFCLLAPVVIAHETEGKHENHADKDSTKQAIAEMTQAAQTLLGSLNEAQKAKASMAFDDENREHFKFTPGERKGLPLGDLDDKQQELARKLLASALSERGVLKASTIIQLEQLLGEMENRPDFRNHKAYCTSIFGKPEANATWGWRFEGHHLAINITIINGTNIAASPAFMGTNPAHVKEGRMKGTHLLEKEESIARTLAVVLQKEGKKVVYTDKAPNDILTAETRKIQQLEAVGVPATELSENQWKTLLELVGEYAHRYRHAIAEQELQRFQAIPREKIFFAWAGSLEPEKPYYYRVQTPSILIEAANTQNDANHMHSVWRDAKDDFGRDSLGEHYKEHAH